MSKLSEPNLGFESEKESEDTNDSLYPFQPKEFSFQIIETFREFNENEIKLQRFKLELSLREILFMNCGWPGAGGAKYLLFFQYCNLSLKMKFSVMITRSCSKYNVKPKLNKALSYLLSFFSY